MQFFTTTIALLAGASVTMAVPAFIQQRQVALGCSGLTGTAQCCATDVLGVADLNCANPPTVPTDEASFVSTCAAIGQQARCCAIPILGQALICGDPL